MLEEPQTLSLRLERRTGDVGVSEVDAIAAIGDEQIKLVRAGDVHIHRLDTGLDEAALVFHSRGRGIGGATLRAFGILILFQLFGLIVDFMILD